MSNSLQPHGLQHTRLPCPPLSPGVCSYSGPLSWMLSNHLILCHSLLLLTSIFPSIRVFSNESVLRIRWPEDWSFSFIISPSNEYSGLISFKIDWFELLAVQGTLKSLLQTYMWNICARPESLQLCLTLCDPLDCSPPGSSVHGILQARILEWVAMPSSRGSSQTKDQTCASLCLLHWQMDSLPLVPPGKPE